jgi:hypothetical protein
LAKAFWPVSFAFGETLQAFLKINKGGKGTAQNSLAHFGWFLVDAAVR